MRDDNKLKLGHGGTQQQQKPRQSWRASAGAHGQRLLTICVLKQLCLYNKIFERDLFT